MSALLVGAAKRGGAPGGARQGVEQAARRCYAAAGDASGAKKGALIEPIIAKSVCNVCRSGVMGSAWRRRRRVTASRDQCRVRCTFAAAVGR